MFGSVWGEVMEMTLWTTVSTALWRKLFLFSKYS
jgi:hypothetical protein